MNAAGRQSRLSDLSPSRKEIELEIPEEEFRQEYEKILGEYAAKVRLDGFRRAMRPGSGSGDSSTTTSGTTSTTPLSPASSRKSSALRLNPV
jgi:hypothetical protein